MESKVWEERRNSRQKNPVVSKTKPNNLEGGNEETDDKNHYLNWLLFPYTHIASPDGGALIGIENYVPVAPTVTRFELKLHSTKTLGHASPIPILKRWLDKAQVVFKEDFDAVILATNNHDHLLRQNCIRYFGEKCKIINLKESLENE